jgi:hypothetical protein
MTAHVLNLLNLRIKKFDGRDRFNFEILQVESERFSVPVKFERSKYNTGLSKNTGWVSAMSEFRR